MYRLSGNLPFETQVIVTSKIPRERMSWLTHLTKHGSADNLMGIISGTRKLDNYHKPYANSIMYAFSSANRKLVRERIKEADMYDLVNLLFADELKEMESQLANKDAQLANKDAQLADKDALIAKLQAQLEKYAGKSEA